MDSTFFPVGDLTRRSVRGFDDAGGGSEWDCQTLVGRPTVPADPAPHRWGVILAGGDGVRLRGLTRFVWGDDRPKQFCPLLGNDTLLQQTRRRAERSIRPDQVVYSLVQAHRDYYLQDLGDRPSQRVVQPYNRGTAPAILHTLLHISRTDPDAVVAILPCDHYYSRESVFTAALQSAFGIAEARPESIVLLGAESKAPEVEYGWIEVGAAVDRRRAVFCVRGFQEKPPLPVARRLFECGSLWNTFVMVGHAGAFFDLAMASAPGLLRSLRAANTSSTDGETLISGWLYDRIDTADFSRQILSRGANRLVALRMDEVEWNDLGSPDRVISALLTGEGELPGWAVRWQAARESELSASRYASMAL
jgi:mannose-1-phosphate guanylyltransferase